MDVCKEIVPITSLLIGFNVNGVISGSIVFVQGLHLHMLLLTGVSVSVFMVQITCLM